METNDAGNSKFGVLGFLVLVLSRRTPEPLQGSFIPSGFWVLVGSGNMTDDEGCKDGVGAELHSGCEFTCFLWAFWFSTSQPVSFPCCTYNYNITIIR